MAKRRQQQTPRIIYIACEGTMTEYWYFKSISESLDDDSNVQLKIYPDPIDWEEIKNKGEKGVKTDHKNLCARVAERLSNNEGIDEGWIVIDKDGHTRLEITFEDAKKAGVKIAFASVSFEHWLLLHFEKNDTAFEKSDCKYKYNGKDKYVLCGSEKPQSKEFDCEGKRCVAGRLRLNKYLNNYEKSDKDIFKKTKPLQELAYENAAWLRWRKREDLVKFKGNEFCVNPYSSVDKLLKSIFEHEEDIHWCYYGDSISIINLRLIIQQLKDKFLISIFNISPTTQVILPEHFFLTNNKSERLHQKFMFDSNKSNLLIEPGQNHKFFITPGLPLYDSNSLNFKFENQRVIFTQ